MIVRKLQTSRRLCVLFCLLLGFLGQNKAFLATPLSSIIGRRERASVEIASAIDDDNDGNGENVPIEAGKSGLGEYKPGQKLEITREAVIVGDPQLKVKRKEASIEQIFAELAMIQKQGPKKYCILGTRHVSYLHQQIIELLAYALVLSGNQVWTSGAGGTHMATIRGALRAGDGDDLLHVVIPQSLHKQPKETQELLKNVTNLISFPHHDEWSLNVASQHCNSYMLNETDQLVAFAFHESSTVLEATKEAKEKEKVVTTLFLD